jgi:hypothetical protein
MIHRLVWLWGVACAASVPAWGADERLDTLTAGKDTFTNVIVLSKTRSNLFITHSKGMVSLKVQDLDPATQLKLGYQLEQPRAARLKQMLTPPDLSRWTSDPELQEWESQLAASAGEIADRLDDRTMYGIVGGLILLYLIFCALCRAICMKAAVAPTTVIPLVWLPMLKQIPLLKAAGMSPWWILTNFVPGLFVVTYLVWSFKIVRARGKHVFCGVMLILPVTNVFAFLYLAFSSSAGMDTSPDRSVISLQSEPRREAA